MKTLLIDTHNSEEVFVGLKINGKKEFLKSETLNLKSENVLSLIKEILKKHRLNLGDIKGIEVAIGPGSFTGLRIGVAIANALGWLLGISINQKKIGEIVEPVYQ